MVGSEGMLQGTYLSEERQLVPAQGAWLLWGAGQKEAVHVVGEVALVRFQVQVLWVGDWIEQT